MKEPSDSFIDPTFSGSDNPIQTTYAQHRVYFITMGCSKNEVDTDAMKRLLVQAGYIIPDDPELADVIVVNTCSFIQIATEESIDAIFEALSLRVISGHEKQVVIAGCMPSRYGQVLSEELHEVSAFVPCSQEDNIVEIIDGLFNRSGNAPDGRTSHESESECDSGKDDSSFDKRAFDENASERASTYAYVKISEGCDRFCSFCTIPFIRGRYNSIAYEDIFHEVERCVSNGAREIVLIAQDTGLWGSDLRPERTLSWLLENLAESFSDTWFRIMYLQPEGVTDELLSAIKEHDNICNYLDIPLQHVVERILRDMNRQGSRKQFEDLVAHIRDVLPDVALRTTLMVGFPGETVDDFEELCDFVDDIGFDYVGIFSYSREEGTKAYDLPEQVDDFDKQLREEDLRDIADAVSDDVIARRAGKLCDVIIEDCDEDGQLYGRCQWQAPDVDGVVYLSSGYQGDKVTVKISETFLYDMKGRKIRATG